MIARKTGRAPGITPNEHMERGHREEEEAARLFVTYTGLELFDQPIGFIRHPSGLVGATPDRCCAHVPLLLEIKSKATRISYGVDVTHWWQMQTQMASTGIHHCVYVQYCSSGPYGSTGVPLTHLCLHLVEYDAPTYHRFMVNLARPFINRLRATASAQRSSGTHGLACR